MQWLQHMYQREEKSRGDKVKKHQVNFPHRVPREIKTL